MESFSCIKADVSCSFCHSCLKSPLKRKPFSQIVAYPFRAFAMSVLTFLAWCVFPLSRSYRLSEQVVSFPASRNRISLSSYAAQCRDLTVRQLPGLKNGMRFFCALHIWNPARLAVYLRPDGRNCPHGQPALPTWIAGATHMDSRRYPHGQPALPTWTAGATHMDSRRYPHG